MLVSGCATAVKYGSLTDVKYPPKTEKDEIVLLIAKLPDRPYKEIGVISVLIPGCKSTLASFNTTDETLNEMRKKARAVGADGVINIVFRSANLASISTGAAIVFTDKGN